MTLANSARGTNDIFWSVLARGRLMRDAAAAPNMGDPLAMLGDVSLLPKVELHVHLEATPRRSTLKRLADQSGMKLPPELDPESGRPPGFDSLDHFLKALSAINALFDSPDVYALLAYEFIENLAKQNVIYAEIRFSPSRPVLDRGMDLGGLIARIHEAKARAERDFGISVGLILCLSRVRGDDVCRDLVRRAVEASDGRLTGFDIADDETRYPAHLFRSTYQAIADAGFPATAHAGETRGPSSVWEAIELPAVRRVGHGLTAHKDPKLVRYLRETGVHLELCPTSNVRTSQIPSLKQHPLRHYVEAGLSVSVNSDDPIAFGTSITTEYGLLTSAFGLSLDEIESLTVNALRAAFAPDDLKAALESKIEAGYAAARAAFAGG